MIRLRNISTALALHPMKSGNGTPLLLLHALGGSSRDWNGVADDWPGSVFALDLSGHGDSEALHGAAYVPELWASDADTALAHIASEAAVAGAGLGAYVALLLAGARPDLIRAALLLPGNGIDGGGADPSERHTILPVGDNTPDAAYDARADAAEQLVRPPRYSVAFAEAARKVVLAEDGTRRPPWWTALHGIAKVEAAPSIGTAWRQFRAAADQTS